MFPAWHQLIPSIGLGPQAHDILRRVRSGEHVLPVQEMLEDVDVVVVKFGWFVVSFGEEDSLDEAGYDEGREQQVSVSRPLGWKQVVPVSVRQAAAKDVQVEGPAGSEALAVPPLL